MRKTFRRKRPPGQSDDRCCNQSEWLPLPAPVENQSITTACLLIKEPIGKAQCKKCGLVQRVYEESLGESDYYEMQYRGYYDRPATLQHHKARYTKMIEWIASSITKTSIDDIIDIGCGQGGAMIALKETYSDSLIEGLEPSVQNSEYAKSLGFNTSCLRMGGDTVLDKKYDLAISIYVAQHVLDPIDFFKGVRKTLKSDGIAAIVIPNGNVPNIELLWSDQNYAFTADMLVKIAKKAGMQLISLHKSPEGISTSWLIIFRNEITYDSKHKNLTMPEFDTKKIYAARCNYLNSFSKLDQYLCGKVKAANRVINFGASFWSSILAAYCPNYWELVDFCTVDNGDGEIMGKRVHPFESIDVTNNDRIIIALAKKGQQYISDRLAKEKNILCVTWYNVIDC